MSSECMELIDWKSLMPGELYLELGLEQPLTTSSQLSSPTQFSYIFGNEKALNDILIPDIKNFLTLKGPSLDWKQHPLMTRGNMDEQWKEQVEHHVQDQLSNSWLLSNASRRLIDHARAKFKHSSKLISLALQAAWQMTEREAQADCDTHQSSVAISRDDARVAQETSTPSDSDGKKSTPQSHTAQDREVASLTPSSAGSASRHLGVLAIHSPADSGILKRKLDASASSYDSLPSKFPRTTGICSRVHRHLPSLFESAASGESDRLGKDSVATEEPVASKLDASASSYDSLSSKLPRTARPSSRVHRDLPLLFESADGSIPFEPLLVGSCIQVYRESRDIRDDLSAFTTRVHLRLEYVKEHQAGICDGCRVAHHDRPRDDRVPFCAYWFEGQPHWVSSDAELQQAVRRIQESPNGAIVFRLRCREDERFDWSDHNLRDSASNEMDIDQLDISSMRHSPSALPASDTSRPSSLSENEDQAMTGSLDSSEESNGLNEDFLATEEPVARKKEVVMIDVDCAATTDLPLPSSSKPDALKDEVIEIDINGAGTTDPLQPPIFKPDAREKVLPPPPSFKSKLEVTIEEVAAMFEQSGMRQVSPPASALHQHDVYPPSMDAMKELGYIVTPRPERGHTGGSQGLHTADEKPEENDPTDGAAKLDAEVIRNTFTDIQKEHIDELWPITRDLFGYKPTRQDMVEAIQLCCFSDDYSLKVYQMLGIVKLIRTTTMAGFAGNCAKMGLGKTFMTIAMIITNLALICSEYLWKEHGASQSFPNWGSPDHLDSLQRQFETCGPTLILVPSIVQKQWLDQCQRYFRSLRRGRQEYAVRIFYYGSRSIFTPKVKEKLALQGFEEFTEDIVDELLTHQKTGNLESTRYVVISSLSMIKLAAAPGIRSDPTKWNLAQKLAWAPEESSEEASAPGKQARKIKWAYVFFDEAHDRKGWDNSPQKFIRSLHSETRVVFLSGTPVEKSLKDDVGSIYMANLRSIYDFSGTKTLSEAFARTKRVKPSRLREDFPLWPADDCDLGDHTALYEQSTAMLDVLKLISGHVSATSLLSANDAEIEQLDAQLHSGIIRLSSTFKGPERKRGFRLLRDKLQTASGYLKRWYSFFIFSVDESTTIWGKSIAEFPPLEFIDIEIEDEAFPRVYSDEYLQVLIRLSENFAKSPHAKGLSSDSAHEAERSMRQWYEFGRDVIVLDGLDFLAKRYLDLLLDEEKRHARKDGGGKQKKKPVSGFYTSEKVKEPGFWNDDLEDIAQCRKWKTLRHLFSSRSAQDSHPSHMKWVVLSGTPAISHAFYQCSKYDPFVDKDGNTLHTTLLPDEPNARHETLEEFNRDDVQSEEERAASGPQPNIIFSTTGIAGTGLNITGTYCVVLLEPQYTVTRENQAARRHCRLSQQQHAKACYVYRFTLPGAPYDRVIVTRQGNRVEAFELVRGFSARLSKSDQDSVGGELKEDDMI